MFLMTFVHFCDVSDSSIDFEVTTPMFLLTFVMFPLTLKTIPLFLLTLKDVSIDFEVYSDVSIDFCDVSDSSIDFEHYFNDLRLGFGLFY